MYQAETPADLLKKKRKLPGSRSSWTRVASTVFLLGTTSLLTDISSEMVSAMLPLYLLVALRFSPFQVGVLDVLYQGASVLVRVMSGLVADRCRRPNQFSEVGCGLSAVCKLRLLIAGRIW